MKCECGYPAFYYQKFSENKKWNVYKCGHIMIESKKKTKCNMNKCEYISDISFNVSIQENIDTPNKIINKEELYKNKLLDYIHLCEITKTFCKKYRLNYIANINYYLKKLNFELYFEEKETLENLKSRIRKKYTPRIIKPDLYPIKLVQYPKYLEVNKKEKLNKKKKRKTVISKIKKIYISTEEREEKEEEILSNDESDNESDNESDIDSEEKDDTFDIDNYDSGDNYDDFDDGGAFSD